MVAVIDHETVQNGIDGTMGYRDRRFKIGIDGSKWDRREGDGRNLCIFVFRRHLLRWVLSGSDQLIFKSLIFAMRVFPS